MSAWTQDPPARKCSGVGPCVTPDLDTPENEHAGRRCQFAMICSLHQHKTHFGTHVHYVGTSTRHPPGSADTALSTPRFSVCWRHPGSRWWTHKHLPPLSVVTLNFIPPLPAFFGATATLPVSPASTPHPRLAHHSCSTAAPTVTPRTPAVRAIVQCAVRFLAFERPHVLSPVPSPVEIGASMGRRGVTR